MSNKNREAKKAFVEPRLEVLEVKSTATGPTPDPTEFPGILEQS